VEIPVKSLVRNTVRRTIGAPLLWLGLGVVLIVAGLGLSYHRIQMEADHAMTMRLGPPEPVAVEEAVLGSVGEGHLIARYHPEQAVTVEIGAPGARKKWLALPLFPDTGAGLEDAPIRPRPRPDTTLQAMAQASGVAVFPPGSRGPEALLAEGAATFEGALNGPLIPADAFALDTSAAFAAVGIALPAEFVAVRPWIEGRAAALAPPPQGPLARYFFWAGTLSILCAIGLSLRPEKGERYLDLKPEEIERKIVTKSRILADEGRFNPLIGQDDIRRGAMERLHAAERAQGRTPSTFLTNTAGKVGAGWVKNRR
jgi:hypothetical protein